MSPEESIDSNWDRILAELEQFLRIPSVSTDSAHRTDIEAAAAWVAESLRAAGPFRVEVLPTAGHPIVYAEWLGAPGRPTILVYGHYDVQPPDPIDRWHSAPFEPEIRDGRIYARGCSDDKGPMFIPIKAAEALFGTEGRLPVNLKLVFEGEEEIGSPSLEGFLTGHRELLSADFALSADGAMWRADLPSITVGSRGMAALNLEIDGPAKDLHSGRHGGAVQNPLHALAELLASLHHPAGSVAVEGFYDAVRVASPAERAAIVSLPWDEDAYREETGVPAPWGESGFSTLERQSIRPTVEVNGLGGGYAGEGSKTVIPAGAFAKLTCRLVPDQEPDRILELVEAHLHRRLPPGVRLRTHRLPGSARAYRIRHDHPGLQVARDVLRELDGRSPVDVLIGGTLPVTEMLARILGVDTVFFSFSTADEDFHAPNEFFRLNRFRDGIRAWIRYWNAAAGLELGGAAEETRA